jgi:hypothetical protein
MARHDLPDRGRPARLMIMSGRDARGPNEHEKRPVDFSCEIADLEGRADRRLMAVSLEVVHAA